MLIRPAAEDFRTIAGALGRVLIVVASASMLPIAVAVIGSEWRPLGSFLLMTGVLAVLGVGLVRISLASKRVEAMYEEHMEWSHGMVVVALTWILVPLIGSIPFLLSGHFGGPLDAYFDAMSGLSTTGLALVQDLDHLAPSLNFWRHLLHFLGGQGIIIAALVLFGGRGVHALFAGEGREDRLLPSVQSTAKAIWAISVLHLVVGVVTLGLVAYVVLGFDPVRSLFHGLMIFFAAFDTGGFAPQSTSLGYYHSAVFELFTAVLMVAGALSFGLHFRMWNGSARRTRDRARMHESQDDGKRRRWIVLRSLETRTILVTFGLTMMLTIFGLAALGIYTSIGGLSRQGFFQILSAHTGTGFTTVPSAELRVWGGTAFGGMTIAMALGGMASSTAGGVKAMRVGLVVRAIRNRVKGDLLPEGALVDDGFYQFGRHRLTPEVAASAMVVSLLFVALFLLGAGMGLIYGVPLDQALFESVSAGASVGLSAGVTSPTMPALLKLTYIVQMLLGRLEFVAVFVLVGFVYSWIRGR
ncbi:MAG: potassium transporter TrkG [Actinomycetota bacterium]